MGGLGVECRNLNCLDPCWIFALQKTPNKDFKDISFFIWPQQGSSCDMVSVGVSIDCSI